MRQFIFSRRTEKSPRMLASFSIPVSIRPKGTRPFDQTGGAAGISVENGQIAPRRVVGDASYCWVATGGRALSLQLSGRIADFFRFVVVFEMQCQRQHGDEVAAGRVVFQCCYKFLAAENQAYSCLFFLSVHDVFFGPGHTLPGGVFRGFIGRPSLPGQNDTGQQGQYPKILFHGHASWLPGWCSHDEGKIVAASLTNGEVKAQAPATGSCAEC